MAKQLYDHSDFEAVIRIFTSEVGGRRTPARNGIRWDFCYADDRVEDSLYMIHPDFFDDAGNSLPTDAPLPLNTPLSARMRIVVEEMRRYHKQRIAPGVRFFCHEGARQVAEGAVSRVTGLAELKSQA